MPGSRRGLVAPQNTFLESIIRKCSGARKYYLHRPIYLTYKTIEEVNIRDIDKKIGKICFVFFFF